MRDFESNIRYDQVLDPANLTADAQSGILDLTDYRYAAFYALVGQSGDTLSGSVYICLEVQESDDGSTFTACADADITNAVTGATTGTFAKIDAASEDDAAYMTEYRGSKRYVRVNVNLVGTHSSGTPVGVLGMRAGDSSLPVTQAT